MAQGFAKSGVTHDEAHSISSHDDTTATGAELETLTDGSNADSLHVHDHDTPIGVHTADDDAHHAKYTDAEVDAIVATHDAIVDAHHAKYTDTEAAAKIASDALYMLTGAAPNAHNIASHDDTTATGAELETLTDGSETTLHSHAGSAPALDDVTDVTITSVGTGEVLTKSSGDWINRTLAEAGIAATAHSHTETRFVVFSETGEMVVKSGTHRFYLPYDVKITEVEMSVGVAPLGAAAIVDVNVNGTTIFTTQSNRPIIGIGGYVGPTTTIEDDEHTNGQYLTVDIDAVGNTTAGSDLTVVISFEKT